MYCHTVHKSILFSENTIEELTFKTAFISCFFGKSKKKKTAFIKIIVFSGSRNYLGPISRNKLPSLWGLIGVQFGVPFC